MTSQKISPSDVPHGEQSFGIRTWQDMFRKLCFELEEFVITRGSDHNLAARGYRALNLAWTAWHLHDWFFESQMDAGDLKLAVVKLVFPSADFEAKKSKRERLALFGEELAARFEALRICRTLATAGKHGKAEHRPMSELRAHEVRPIEWMPPGPNGPIYYDVRILVGNVPWDARDLFVQAIADWRNFFALISEAVPDTQLSV
ncbi:MAG: hypothetical protein EPN31_06060 [Castellaniella sp.]|uniref:hypothetical protein n=1 Tax=Castellaniella sp. TaxID=1955812 RepID=UPI0011F60E2B|nr:hypothetical protein [Castellaniella sp.]TAN29639.1 MAG: hypothetical protein EPN31_06060 [Castellaniella sp.]